MRLFFFHHPLESWIGGFNGRVKYDVICNFVECNKKTKEINSGKTRKYIYADGAKDDDTGSNQDPLVLTGNYPWIFTNCRIISDKGIHGYPEIKTSNSKEDKIKYNKKYHPMSIFQPDDVIIFGGVIGYEMLYIDTVFVIGDSVEYSVDKEKNANIVDEKFYKSLKFDSKKEFIESDYYKYNLKAFEGGVKHFQSIPQKITPKLFIGKMWNVGENIEKHLEIKNKKDLFSFIPLSQNTDTNKCFTIPMRLFENDNNIKELEFFMKKEKYGKNLYFSQYFTKLKEDTVRKILFLDDNEDKIQAFINAILSTAIQHGKGIVVGNIHKPQDNILAISSAY